MPSTLLCSLLEYLMDISSIFSKILAAISFSLRALKQNYLSLALLFIRKVFLQVWSVWAVGRMTRAFTWPSLYNICHKISTKSVNTRTTTATRTGFVHRRASCRNRYTNRLFLSWPNIIALRAKFAQRLDINARVFSVLTNTKHKAIFRMRF